ncbi:MAG: thioredoxin family protein [Bacilli bacterium]|nr:thioredoxin family protein [Bacilli bacterium]
MEILFHHTTFKKITNNLPEDTLYYKVEVNNDFTLYNVNTLPTLLIFKNKKLLGHIDGYYNNDNIEEFIDKLNNIIEK